MPAEEIHDREQRETDALKAVVLVSHTLLNLRVNRRGLPSDRSVGARRHETASGRPNDERDTRILGPSIACLDWHFLDADDTRRHASIRPDSLSSTPVERGTSTPQRSWAFALPFPCCNTSHGRPPENDLHPRKATKAGSAAAEYTGDPLAGVEQSAAPRGPPELRKRDRRLNARRESSRRRPRAGMG